MTRPMIFCSDCGKSCPEYARGLCGPCYTIEDSHRQRPFAEKTRPPVQPGELQGRRNFKRRHPTKTDPLGVKTA